MAKSEPGEVLVQFAVRDRDERKINTRFAPQLVPRVLGTVPGISYIADQGRPRASEVVAFWPALVSRDVVKQRVVIGDEEIPVPDQVAGGNEKGPGAFFSLRRMKKAPGPLCLRSHRSRSAAETVSCEVG
jgi:hypothetical protein